jgi:hypothetical protein
MELQGNTLDAGALHSLLTQAVQEYQKAQNELKALLEN